MTTTEYRRQAILDFVSSRSFAGVNDLAAMFNVTTATIRTDLQALEDDGKVIRSHGGVVPAVRPVSDLHEDVKSKENVDQKKRIAAAAAKLVGANDSIIIASGSTMACFAEAITPIEHLNVVTPSVRIAIKLINKEKISLVQLGGQLYPNSLSSRGTIAEAQLENFHCNQTFFGVEGFDLKCGLTCATAEEANLTRKMIERSSNVVVLADSTKLSRKGFGHICDLSDIDVLVTDTDLPEESRLLIEEKGVKVILV